MLRASIQEAIRMLLVGMGTPHFLALRFQDAWVSHQIPSWKCLEKRWRCPLRRGEESLGLWNSKNAGFCSYSKPMKRTRVPWKQYKNYDVVDATAVCANVTNVCMFHYNSSAVPVPLWWNVVWNHVSKKLCGHRLMPHVGEKEKEKEILEEVLRVRVPETIRMHELHHRHTEGKALWVL